MRNRQHRIAALFVAFLILGACGEDAGSAGSDLAGTNAIIGSSSVEEGVRVVLHHGEAFDRAPRLVIDEEPLAILGGADGEAEFDLTNASNVVLLSDGRIATLAPVGNRLLIFAADGSGERSLGRQGRGPGEIMAPSGMIALDGDTLLVPDGANRRLNWIVPDEGFVATRPLEGMMGMPFLDISGVLPGGRLVASSGGLLQRPVGEGRVRPPTPVAVLDPVSGESREIASIPDLELVQRETRYRGERRMDWTPLQFSPRALVVVWDSLVVTSAPEGYSLELRDDSGRIVSRIVVAGRPRQPVTVEMREALIARQLARFSTSSGERMVDPEESKRLVREQPFADSLPAYSFFFVTPTETLWVTDSSDGESAAAATAFRRDGAIIGRLLIPSDAGAPVAFGDDRVVLRVMDENDVVSLRVHRIVEAR